MQAGRRGRGAALQIPALSPEAAIRPCPAVDADSGLHALQQAKTGALSEYAVIGETFSPEALETPSGWIVKRVVG